MHSTISLTAAVLADIQQTLAMSNTKIVHVPHLGGIDASYQMPHPYDPSKPTLILVNSFTTSS